MAASANESIAAIPLVLVLEASDALVERCRSAVGSLARVAGVPLEAASSFAGKTRVRAIVLTVDAYGRNAQPVTDLARRLQARVVKLPSEQMPNRYLEEVLVDAVGSSGVRRRF